MSPRTTISGTVTDVLAPGSTVAASGIAGVKVFLDINDDGTFDAGEPYTDTDSTGHYRFLNLAPGTYHVVIIPPDGEDAATAATQEVAISDRSDKATDVDFQLSRQDTTPPTALISYPASTTGQDGRWLDQVSGRVDAPHGGADVADVRVSVEDQETGLYWNGVAFADSNPVYLDARGTSSWSLPMAATALSDGHSYTISSLAIDQEGDAQVTPTVQTFSYAAPQIDIPAAAAPTPPVATVVGVTSSAASSVAGQPITFTIRVAPAPGVSGAPTGSVVLLDGSSVLATLPLVNGMASYQTEALAEGAHAIAAIYSGDAGFQAGYSTPIIQSVQRFGIQSSSTTTAQALVVGGSGLSAGATITVKQRPHSGRIRVIVSEPVGHTMRPILSRTYKAKDFSEILIYPGSASPTVHVRGDIRLPVAVQGENGIVVLHDGPPVRGRSRTTAVRSSRASVSPFVPLISREHPSREPHPFTRGAIGAL